MANICSLVTVTGMKIKTVYRVESGRVRLKNKNKEKEKKKKHSLYTRVFPYVLRFANRTLHECKRCLRTGRSNLGHFFVRIFSPLSFFSPFFFPLFAPSYTYSGSVLTCA